MSNNEPTGRSVIGDGKASPIHVFRVLMLLDLIDAHEHITSLKDFWTEVYNYEKQYKRAAKEAAKHKNNKELL